MLTLLASYQFSDKAHVRTRQRPYTPTARTNKVFSTSTQDPVGYKRFDAAI